MTLKGSLFLGHTFHWDFTGQVINLESSLLIWAPNQWIRVFSFIRFPERKLILTSLSSRVKFKSSDLGLMSKSDWVINASLKGEWTFPPNSSIYSVSHLVCCSHSLGSRGCSAIVFNGGKWWQFPWAMPSIWQILPFVSQLLRLCNLIKWTFLLGYQHISWDLSYWLWCFINI